MISKSILIISAVSVSVMLLISIVFAVTVYSAPTSNTGSTKVSSNGESCYEKILGYARIGAYQDKETFKAALSYCSPSSGLQKRAEWSLHYQQQLYSVIATPLAYAQETSTVDTGQNVHQRTSEWVNQSTSMMTRTYTRLVQTNKSVSSKTRKASR